MKNNAPEDLAAILDAQEQEARGKLEALAAKLDAEHAFRVVASNFLIRMSSEGFDDGKHGNFTMEASMAAYFLYPHFGSSGSRDLWLIQQLFDLLERYTTVRSMSVSAPRGSTPATPMDMLLSRTRLYGEAIRGSGSHNQIKERILGVQAPHEAWFQQKVGVGPERALKILRAAEQAMNANSQRVHGRFMKNFADLEQPFIQEAERVINARRKGKRPPDTKAPQVALELFDLPHQLAEEMPVSAAQVQEFLPDLADAEWTKLLALVGFTPENRATMKGPGDTRNFPLFVLGGSTRMIVVDGCFLFDAVYDRFEQVARSNQRFYEASYDPGRKAWSESKVVEYLRRVFPADCVFETLDYPDPDKPGELATAEMDAAVVWGPFLLLVEVKARQFRETAQLGHLKHLKDDLRENVWAASDQAKRAERYITATDSPEFIERNTRRKLRVKKGKGTRIYRLAVTLKQFGWLMNQLGDLQLLKLFQSGEFPFALCLHDLDTITRFCESPDVFLHYTDRRLQWQDDPTKIMGTELDIFGAYLENRLHPGEQRTRVVGPDHSDPVMLMFSMSEQFDSWWEADRRGKEEEKPQIALKLPAPVREALQELRKRRDDDSRFIAFALLGLSADGTEELARSLKADVGPIPPGQFRRTSFVDHGMVVLVIHTASAPTESFKRKLQARMALEAYRLRANQAIAFGRRHSVKPEPIIEHAMWQKGEWQFEETLDKYTKEEGVKLAPGQKLPKRNDPCFCGSGIKFKKCCMGRVQTVPTSTPLFSTSYD